MEIMQAREEIEDIRPGDSVMAQAVLDKHLGDVEKCIQQIESAFDDQAQDPQVTSQLLTRLNYLQKLVEETDVKLP